MTPPDFVDPDREPDVAVIGSPEDPFTPTTNQWGTLLTVALGVVMVGLDATVVSIANPAIASSLNASLGSLQWITNAYLLALAVLLIPGGKLGDRFGRKKVFLIGVVGFTLASVGVAVIGSVSGVIGMRALQGAFGALLLPNTIALLRAAFPADELNPRSAYGALRRRLQSPARPWSVGCSWRRSRGRACSS